MSAPFGRKRFVRICQQTLERLISHIFKRFKVMIARRCASSILSQLTYYLIVLCSKSYSHLR